MAAPTTIKTWEHTLNNVITADDAQSGEGGHLDRRKLMFAIKSDLIDGGIFTLPWVVELSSNGTVADGTDNWATVADVDWELDGEARSWIVLYNSGLGIRMLIDLLNNTGDFGTKIEIVISRNVFTGGTTSTQPTTTEGMILQRKDSSNATDNSWGTGAKATAGHQFIYHISMPTDGTALRIMIGYNNVALGFWNFERPQSSPSEWEGLITSIYTNLTDVGVLDDTDDVLSDSYKSVVAYFPNRATDTSGVITTKKQVYPELGTTKEGALDSDPARVHGLHPITGNPVVYRFNWLSPNPSTRTKLGEATDIWVVNTALTNHGDTSPVAQEDFILWGPFVLPWDGSSAPVLT